MQVRENDFPGNAVTYSGPKYCAIPSAKHCGSSAYHHLQDMKRIRSLDIFGKISLQKERRSETINYCYGRRRSG